MNEEVKEVEEQIESSTEKNERVVGKSIIKVTRKAFLELGDGSFTTPEGLYKKLKKEWTRY